MIASFDSICLLLRNANTAFCGARIINAVWSIERGISYSFNILKIHVKSYFLNRSAWENLGPLWVKECTENYDTSLVSHCLAAVFTASNRSLRTPCNICFDVHTSRRRDTKTDHRRQTREKLGNIVPFDNRKGFAYKPGFMNMKKTWVPKIFDEWKFPRERSGIHLLLRRFTARFTRKQQLLLSPIAIPKAISVQYKFGADPTQTQSSACSQCLSAFSLARVRSGRTATLP